MTQEKSYVIVLTLQENLFSEHDYQDMGRKAYYELQKEEIWKDGVKRMQPGKPPIIRKREIIEFNAVPIGIEKNEILEQFHAYVKPTEDVWISEKCISVTRVKQYYLEQADKVTEVLNKFDQWLQEHKIINTIMVVLNAQEFQRLFNHQLKQDKIVTRWKDIPSLDLRNIFKNSVPNSPSSTDSITLRLMLDNYDLKYEGHLDSPRDQGFNQALVISKLLRDGAEMKEN